MSSSRIIIKNLPKSATEAKLRDLFGKQGTITDVQLKYTPDGRFRHFAFIGFSTESEAEGARLYFDKTYMGAAKLDVQSCTKLGDPSKPRAWSKYAADSSTGKAAKRKANVPEKEENESTEAKKPRKKKKEEEILEKCREDPDFLEFLEIHRKKSSWGNDTVLDDLRKFASTEEESKNLTVPGDDLAKSKDSAVAAPMSKPEAQPTTKSKKKKKKSKDTISTVAEVEDGEPRKKKKKRRQVGSAIAELFTVKLRDLPEKAKKKEIREFFAPLVPRSVRLPPKFRGFAYVGFKTEEELNNSLRKDKSFILGKRVTVRQIDTNKLGTKNAVEEKLSRWASQTAELEKESETIGESGRIFIRNLAYTTTEDQIQEFFEKFGPVTEVHLPLDRLTRKIKGFGFVSFLLPEHATKAFNELDGTVFQGRMLHLLPSKNKLEPSLDDTANTGSAFKKLKALKQKKNASSSYNWNTLFMGQNAVAKVVSEKYGVSREELLLEKTDEIDRNQPSIGVRMALAEAEIVDETKNFLIDNDVCLESFENAKSERSKTVILAKNLPANTVAKDLVDLFSKHGELGRLVLPPSGITAIVEFIEPAEARAAFKKLSYTNFGGMPLYLEFAPSDTFKSRAAGRINGSATETRVPETTGNVSKPDESIKKTPITPVIVEEEDAQLDMIPEPDTTLFVKNLNFNSTEQSLKKHFKSCGPVYSVTIARRKDSKLPGQLLSMGFGFVQFYQIKHAQKAMKELQGTMLENHILELKKSNRTLQTTPASDKSTGTIPISLESKTGGSKLLVRNVPFQANQSEIKQLFLPFGEIRACRLPLKMDGSGEHRGFAFVDFMSQAMAVKAFDTLGKSTHLYGRRLVIEWAQKEETVETLRQKTAQQFELQSSASRSKSVSAKKGISRYFNSADSKKSTKADEEDDD